MMASRSQGVVVRRTLSRTVRQRTRCPLEAVAADDFTSHYFAAIAHTTELGGTMTEADVLAVLKELTGRSWAAEFKAWVHGTSELPVRDLLAKHGVTVSDEPAQLAQRLGLRVGEDHSVQIKTVLHGSADRKSVV